MATQAPSPSGAVFAPPAWGSSHPIGATLTRDGVNLSVYAKQATGIDVLLFDAPRTTSHRA